jgi:hypothetical protein
MTLQFSVPDRTAFAAQLVTAAAGGAIKFFSGTVTANCAAADPTGPLASGTLPTPALTSASGVATKAGSWTLTGSAAGTAASFRVYDSTTVCRMQGTVTASGAGGDMTVDNPVIASLQVVTVVTFAITFANA